MTRVWIFFLSVISNCWCEKIQRYGTGGIDDFTEFKNNHASSSCEWKGPPKNSKIFMLCAVGECEVTEAGIYSANGTIRTTHCDPHYTLIQGYERDVCNNGEWSSSGHECVPCGKSPRTFDEAETAALIIGGSYSDPGDFPWMAAVFRSLFGDPWTLICGGTLISPYVVLTAAHCLDLNRRRLTTAEIKVGLGRLSIDFSSKDNGSIISSVKDILLPDKYLGKNRKFDIDIGLIVLEERVPISDLIMPACIDWTCAMKPQNNDFGVLAGWGLTNAEKKTESKFLKWTLQKYIRYQECRKMINSTEHSYLSPDKFCADQVEGGTADHGDSGGGLTFVRDGIHYVYGIVSTKMLTNSTSQLRFFTNLMDEGHRSWLKTKWNKLLAQPRREDSTGNTSLSGGNGCTAQAQCPPNMGCVRSTCVDTCLGACGTNSECQVENHNPICFCGPGYTGDPFTVCTREDSGGNLGTKECLWLTKSVGKEVFNSTETCSIIEKQLQSDDPNIVNGVELPYVGIIGDRNFKEVRYGVLISDRWFLSTAYCHDVEICNKQVKLGIAGGPVPNSPSLSDYDVIAEYLHPDYETLTINTIGLFKLKTLVNFNKFIRPACVIDDHQLPGTQGVVVAESNGMLMTDTTYILYGSQCQGNRVNMSESMLCVNYFRSRKNALMTYPGLPMVRSTQGSNCTYGLLGMSNFGKALESNGYIRLAHYLKWIENTIITSQYLESTTQRPKKSYIQKV